MRVLSDARYEDADDVGVTRVASRFPADFVWGVATSAYQIEGAAFEAGRGESIWDRFCALEGVIADGSSGAVACDHYHRLESDLDLIAALGVSAYRFSVAWPRVQPAGRGPWNEEGFGFYRRLIDGLKRRGITPHLTLYHWDLPQALQDDGGWGSRDTVDCFVRYALEVATRFGADLGSICTHNEPWVVAVLGHETGIFAPGLKSRQLASQVSHHLLLSHGRALRQIRAAGVRCPLGIVLNQSPIHPATDSEADRRKARLDDGMIVRWYMDPLLLGAYPEDVLAHLGADAPQIAPGDLVDIKQPHDFVGINYYTRGVAVSDLSAAAHKPTGEVTDMGWEVYPQGLTELLCRLHADYPMPPVYITENGAAFVDVPTGDRVHDEARVRYLRSHISAVADARDRGVDVRGYFVWSFLDNFEWASGYSKRFGIVRVEYATQRRMLKDSALWVQQLMAACRSLSNRQVGQ